MVLFESIVAFQAHLKYIFPCIAVLCFLGSLWGPESRPFLKGLFSGVLAGAALLSVALHIAPQVNRGEYLNAYEFFHYYLGSKYADELGYTKLYRATVIAQSELKHRPMPARIRDLSTGRLETVAPILQNPEQVKGDFSPVRWEAFQLDVDFFWNRFSGKSLWERMLRDKGYNATPVWTMFGGALANRVPVERVFWMQGLAALDQILFLFTVCVIWRVMGHQAALLLIVLFYTHYFNSHATLKAAYLRLDWLCALMLSFVAIRAKRPGMAGALCAYSAAVRVFPIFFALGPMLLYAGHGIWKREQNPDYKGFVFGFFQCGAVLIFASVVYAGGITPWLAFWEKILAHSNDFSGWRIGLKYLFLWSSEGSPASGLSPAEHMARFYWPYRVLQLTLLAIWMTALFRQRPEHVFALGVVPFFILSDATYYYWVVLLLPLLFFLASPIWLAARIGVVALFLTSALGHWLYTQFGRSYETFFWLSLVTAMLMIWMLVTGWERWLLASRSVEK